MTNQFSGCPELVLHQRLLMLLLLGISHRSSYGVRARNVSPLCERSLFDRTLDYTNSSSIPCPSTQLTLSQSRLGGLIQSQTPKLRYLSSHPHVEGSPRIDKSHLLRLHCSKPIVIVKMSPIADLETRLHVIHATLQHLFSHIHDEVISD